MQNEPGLAVSKQVPSPLGFLTCCILKDSSRTSVIELTMTKLLLEACVPKSNSVSPRNRQVLGVPVGTAKGPSLAGTGRRGPRLAFWPVLLNLNKDDRDPAGWGSISSLKQRAEAEEPDVCKGCKQI